jgi:hypothetical protein
LKSFNVRRKIYKSGTTPNNTLEIAVSQGIVVLNKRAERRPELS